MFEVTITGDSADDIRRKMEEFLGKDTTTPLTPTGVLASLDQVPFQDFLVVVEPRLDAEGYDVVKKKPLVAERKKEEARAKLRGELEASVALGETETKVEEEKTEETGETEEIVPPLPVKPAKAAKKVNGPVVDLAKVKAECISRLRDLHTNLTTRPLVNKILADHGGGAKNFTSVPEENFVGIKTALEALG